MSIITETVSLQVVFVYLDYRTVKVSTRLVSKSESQHDE